MDRETPTGFPDALLLATPPFNSINERELGTTFGLRAQDAIGWNPRSFRFLTSPAALEEGRKLFLSLKTAPGKAPAAGDAKALQRLLELQARSASGQLKILDAHIVPGVGDAAPWAQQWALAAMRTPHSNETATGGRSTAHGELRWIKFSLTLWLPQGWKTPRELKNAPAACAQ